MSKHTTLLRPATRAPRSLDEQLTDSARECVAVLLGFSSLENASGFHVTMNEIAPLPLDFTIGEALQAYLAHILARQRRVTSTLTE
jgi:hypothetical protein